MLSSNWPVPFIIDPRHLAADALIAFVVSVLLAIMVNAEAQAFAATFLGDARSEAKGRFHFNAFLHLSLLGTICYLVAGFGWPRLLDIDTGKFKHPRLYTVLTRTAGPLANLLLAGIAGSLALIIGKFEFDPLVFFMVVGVNITTAVYNLIILPPLAGGVLLNELIPPRYASVRQLFSQVGPFLILALALLDRFGAHGIVSPCLNPIVVAIYDFIGTA